MSITNIIQTDDKIGHWRVLRVVHRRVLAACVCGATHEIAITALQDGTNTSCGCRPPSVVLRTALAQERQRRQERGR
jgi:hypothetical protein